MSALSDRTSSKRISRPNARRAMKRIHKELEVLIKNSPMAKMPSDAVSSQTLDRVNWARRSVSDAMMTICRLYGI